MRLKVSREKEVAVDFHGRVAIGEKGISVASPGQDVAYRYKKGRGLKLSPRTKKK